MLQRQNYTTCIATLIVAAAIVCGCKESTSVPAANENASTDFEPVAPVYEMTIDSPADDPTVKNAGEPDPRGERIREQSREILQAGGFQFSAALPTAGHRLNVPGKLRPIREVALRLMALDALFTWVNSPESSVSSDRLKAYVERSNLQGHLTREEREIMALSREEAHEQHNDGIGWHLENMWALAWILGFDPPPDPMSGQIPNDVSRAVVLEFLPGLDASVDDLLAKAKPRSEEEVAEMEDRFYCAHNAVRSAQTGSTTSVPEGFHPIRDGGAIHERRHSLTWAMSPGTEWNDTDLST